jgi:hypothetical protein
LFYLPKGDPTTLSSFTKISSLKNRIDVLKASLYSTKEKGNVIINKLYQPFTNMPRSINRWSNNLFTNYVFQQIQQTLNIDGQRNFISNEYINQFATVRAHKDNAYFLS